LNRPAAANAALDHHRASSAEFEETERRLVEWGMVCGTLAEKLGVEKSTSAATMLETVQNQMRVFERQRKGVKKSATSAAGRRECLDCGHVRVWSRWGKKVGGTWQPAACPNCGSGMWRERELTARGRQTPSFTELTEALSSEVMEIDNAVARLPFKWMRVAIHRSYRFGQTDKEACQDLRMTRSAYRQRRVAAVEMIALMLSERRGRLHRTRKG